MHPNYPPGYPPQLPMRPGYNTTMQGIQGIPMQGMPMQGMPMQGMPMQGMPMHMQGMPMQGMPIQSMPIPMQGMPMVAPGMMMSNGFVQPGQGLQARIPVAPHLAMNVISGTSHDYDNKIHLKII